MAKVIIFGLNDFAELAHFYLENDTEHEVVAFTVNKEYKNQEHFKDLPVIEYEEINKYYSSKDFKFFAPLSPTKNNTIREKIYLDIKKKEYTFVSYISSKAVYYNTPIGENCFIFESNVIQPFTEIGNNVIIWSGNHIGHHTKINDNVFIASHVVISGHCNIGSNSFIGVNATISNNIEIGNNNFIGAGALITQNTLINEVYRGIKAELLNIPSNRLRN